MDSIEHESSLFDEKHACVETIALNFPPNLKAQLTQAAELMSDRHLGTSAIFLFELAHASKQEGNREVTPNPYLAEQYSTEEQSRYTCARFHFDKRDYVHCIGALDEDICCSERSRFLRLLAEFKHIIRSATRDMHDEVTISSTDLLVSHTAFDALRRKLEQKAERGQLDAFGLYLYGLVLAANKQKSEARKALVDAIRRQPFLWAAWRALLKVAPPSREQLLNELPQGAVLSPFFQIEWNIAICEAPEQTVAALNEMLDMFPQSTWVHAQLGEVYAVARLSHQSIAAFEKLRKLDPSRLDNMNTLSNQYYIMGLQAKLSILVHELWSIEKYHWETCVATGNLFSLRQDRARAISYFRRAIQMKPDFISAWTLIGHEYIEMRNFAEAISSYHKGINLDPSDSRAWFGLGQAFFFLKMYSFSAQNFLKAANLKKSDERIWMALGDTFAELDNLDYAKKAYKRAISCGGANQLASIEKMARICQKLGLARKTAQYWELFLGESEADGFVPDSCDAHTTAYIYLSEYYLNNNDEQCAHYAKKCLEYVETMEHGTRVIRLLKDKDKDMSTGEWQQSVHSFITCRTTSEERPEPLGSTGKGEACGFVESEKKEKNLEDFFRLMDPEGFSSGDKK